MRDKLYIVMPAYNEEQNIERVVRGWYGCLGDGQDNRLVVADAGSSDRTREILHTLQGEFPRLQILKNTPKEHGPKCIALYRYAIHQRADYIFQTDSDGQTEPEEFAAFWEKREMHDVMIGDRRKRGDGLVRFWIEKVVTILLFLFFRGIRVPDANAPFRLMRASCLQRHLRRIPQNYLLPNIILTAFFCYYKEDVAFYEISFGARQGGKNSIHLSNIIKIGLRALFEFAAFRKQLLRESLIKEER